jgi:hypothetical protein
VEEIKISGSFLAAQNEDLNRALIPQKPCWARLLLIFLQAAAAAAVTPITLPSQDLPLDCKRLQRRRRNYQS